MARVSVKFRANAEVSAWIVCNLVFGLNAFAQELNRPPAPGTWAVSSEQRAEYFLGSYDFVVAGEFVGYPKDVAGDLTRNGRKEVVVPFAVSRIFKTYLPLDTMQVQFDADMLRYPGEEISRYAKRREFRQQHAAWREQFAEQMAELREAQLNGFITAQEFRQREAELLTIHDAVVADAVEIPSRFVGVLHGETFYDLGGAIKPHEQYLLGLELSREDPSVFVLTEVPPNRNIYWGQMREEIAGLLDRAVSP